MSDTVTRKAILDTIGFDTGAAGYLSVRWQKVTSIDGVPVRSEPHRALIGPDDDLEATLWAVTADLTALGFGEPDAEGLAALRAVAAER